MALITCKFFEEFTDERILKIGQYLMNLCVWAAYLLIHCVVLEQFNRY